jgi:hypothetical protein
VTVRVSTRRSRPKTDAAKALALAADRRTITFTGDPRHLRKVRDLLAGHDVETFLSVGDHRSEAVLVMMPPGGVGWGSDRI